MEELSSKCSKIPNCLSITIFAAILGMFQFGFNTGVMNAPQVSGSVISNYPWWTNFLKLFCSFLLKNGYLWLRKSKIMIFNQTFAISLYFKGFYPKNFANFWFQAQLMYFIFYTKSWKLGYDWLYILIYIFASS